MKSSLNSVPDKKQQSVSAAASPNPLQLLTENIQKSNTWQNTLQQASQAAPARTNPLRSVPVTTPVRQNTPKKAGDKCLVKADATLRDMDNIAEESYTKVKAGDTLFVISGDGKWAKDGGIFKREFVLVRNVAGKMGFIRDTNITRKQDGELMPWNNLAEVTLILKYARRELFKAHYSEPANHADIRRDGIKTSSSTSTNERWGGVDKNLKTIKGMEESKQKLWNYDKESGVYHALYYFDRPSTDDAGEEGVSFSDLANEYHRPNDPEYGDRLIFLQDDNDKEIEYDYDAQGSSYGTTKRIRNKPVTAGDLLPPIADFPAAGQSSEFDAGINRAMDPFITRIILKAGMTVAETKTALANTNKVNFFRNLLYDQ